MPGRRPIPKKTKNIKKRTVKPSKMAAVKKLKKLRIPSKG